MSWLFCSSVILFAFSLFSALFDYFSLSIPFLSGLFKLVTSSSIFLTFVCAAAIVAIWRKRQEDRSRAVISIVIYSIDLAMVNKLYLNSTWKAIGSWFQNTSHVIKGWNWPVILVSAFCAAVAAALIMWSRPMWKSGPYGRRKKPDAKLMPAAKATPAQSGVPDTAGENTAEESGQNASDPDNGGAPQNKQSEPTSFAYGLVCILLIFPATALIQYICYRVLNWNIDLPNSMSHSVDILFYIGTISFGVVTALLLWISKKTHSGGDSPHPALWALFAEVIILTLFFSGAKIVNEDLLNAFLTAAANNTLVAIVVIPIVLFVVLDIGISLFINIFFRKPLDYGGGWLADARGAIDKIQGSIVMFVLNLFAGLINVLLLIPDFLSEIGELLLEKDNLFPRTKPNPTTEEKPLQEDTHENISAK